MEPEAKARPGYGTGWAIGGVLCSLLISGCAGFTPTAEGPSSGADIEPASQKTGSDGVEAGDEGDVRATGDPGFGTVSMDIAGVYVNGREDRSGLFLIRDRDGNHWLPLRDLERLLGIVVEHASASVRLQTPLGDTHLRIGNLVQHDGRLHVQPEALAQALSARIRWDTHEVAYRFQLLWDPRWEPTNPDTKVLKPDTKAPGFSVSRIRGEARVEDRRGRMRHSAFTDISGRAGDGVWQVRGVRGADRESALTDYHWRTQQGRFKSLIGHQVVSGHALMSGIDLTGVQTLWTNGPEGGIDDAVGTRLDTDTGTPIRSFRGEGPSGGIAELRINGIARERRRIPLDGTFEFIDVEVPPGFVEVEVALFDPFDRGAPVDVIDFSARTHRDLLPGGTTRVYAGGGLEGNPFDPRVPDRGEAFLVNVRQAITDAFTLETAVQAAADGTETALGLTANAGAMGVFSASVARRNDRASSLFRLDGQWKKGFWRFSLRDREEGVREGMDGDERDFFGEIGYRAGSDLEVSIVARERVAHGRDETFLLPAFRWRPHRNLTLKSRPDGFGDYVHDINASITSKTRLRARQDRNARRLGVDHRWSDAWSGSATVMHDRERGDLRGGLGVTWRESDPFGWFVDAQALLAETGTGFAVEAGREIMPGLRFRVQARNDPATASSGAQGDTTVRATLAWDFGVGPGGLTRSGVERPNRGTIGGRLKGAPEGADLSGVGVRINGQVRARTDAAGRFRVAGIEPGVYRVALDEEGLPMNLSKAGRRIRAEVAAGAVTPVEFEVEMKLGAAGRITESNGKGIENRRIEVVDAKGAVRASAQTNAFGYWRVDGLKPGRYRVRWVQDGSVRAERAMTLRTKFLFGQDMELDASSFPGDGE